MEGTVFGFNEEQIADFFSTWGVGAFILFMLFIIGEIAWKSKAGKTGTFVLFYVLAGIPLARFIDRGPRKWIVASAIVLQS